MAGAAQVERDIRLGGEAGNAAHQQLGDPGAQQAVDRSNGIGIAGSTFGSGTEVSRHIGGHDPVAANLQAVIGAQQVETADLGAIELGLGCAIDAVGSRRGRDLDRIARLSGGADLNGGLIRLDARDINRGLGAGASLNRCAGAADRTGDVGNQVGVTAGAQG